MITYTIIGPNGKEIIVTVPENATREQIQAAALAEYKKLVPDFVPMGEPKSEQKPTVAPAPTPVPTSIQAPKLAPVTPPVSTIPEPIVSSETELPARTPSGLLQDAINFSNRMQQDPYGREVVDVLSGVGLGAVSQALSGKPETAESQRRAMAREFNRLLPQMANLSEADIPRSLMRQFDAEQPPGRMIGQAEPRIGSESPPGRMVGRVEPRIGPEAQTSIRSNAISPLSSIAAQPSNMLRGPLPADLPLTSAPPAPIQKDPTKPGALNYALKFTPERIPFTMQQQIENMTKNPEGALGKIQQNLSALETQNRIAGPGRFEFSTPTSQQGELLIPRQEAERRWRASLDALNEEARLEQERARVESAQAEARARGDESRAARLEQARRRIAEEIARRRVTGTLGVQGFIQRNPAAFGAAAGSIGGDLAQQAAAYQAQGDPVGAAIAAAGSFGSALGALPHPLARGAAMVSGPGALSALYLREKALGRPSVMETIKTYRDPNEPLTLGR